LNIYKKILTPGGIVNLKTDADSLYDYTLAMIKENELKLFRAVDDLYSMENLTDEDLIKTKYEKMHLEEGKKIKIISFGF